MDEVVRLSKKFGIITEFTSFLVEEGRILADAETRERTIMHFRTSSAKKAGSWAISQRQNAVAMQNQSQLPTNTFYDEAGNIRRITQIQNVNNRIFYNRKGVWVDDRFKEEQKVMKVKNFSEAYFQLVRANPKLGRFLALGEEVVIVINDQAIKVGEKGKVKFTKTELESIIGSH